eukprot:CAMPEP_0178476460 /NCGR_PEP_ID=MMETSP0696-20121128/3637_1 /TAXON_ID=265572 /ORGANISM="Extubocellulus spinifer, Strain CCMP396" /LENGTH=374 /DNA_ID=CAMNT_0020103761 /DNA_START=388 /DNA_END=1512 /DNA_ORIENTATION=-
MSRTRSELRRKIVHVAVDQTPPAIPTIALHTGGSQSNNLSDASAVRMPLLGIGTYKFKKGSGEAYQAVLDALSVGIRHIDTAFIYGGEKTETEIGEALSSKECTVAREDIFLTSKQWRAFHGYDATLKCLDLSLKRLQTSYLDLYLIHWPGPAYDTMSRNNDVMKNSPNGAFVYAKEGHSEANMVKLRAESYRAMEDAVYRGKCRAIGVSNFTVKHLESLRTTARIWPPAVNQIELHPYNPQSEIVAYCQEHGIVVEAYASLGGQDSGKKTWKKLGGKLTERNEVLRIAKKHDKTAAQVLLRWATQQGHAVIPKTGNIEHMRENIAAVVDNEWAEGGLIDADMSELSKLDQHSSAEDKARLCWVRDPLKHLQFD